MKLRLKRTKLMDENQLTNNPLFIFERDTDIKPETGILFAGKLIVDTPKNEPADQLLVEDIISRLVDFAHDGSLPDDPNIVVVGWRDGMPESDKIRLAWRQQSLSLAIRAEHDDDGPVRIHIGPVFQQ
jgi:hypothetical protein